MKYLERWTKILKYRPLHNGSLLWCSAPTRLNNDLLNDGCMLELFDKVIDLVKETSFKIPRLTDTFTRTFLPRCAKTGDADTSTKKKWKAKVEMQR